MELLSDTVQDLHPITVHFPIALLIMSAGLSIILFIKPNAAMQQATWVLLWVGTVSAVVSSIAGLISHVRYEETAVYGVIETHQNWSLRCNRPLHRCNNLAMALPQAPSRCGHKAALPHRRPHRRCGPDDFGVDRWGPGL